MDLLFLGFRNITRNWRRSVLNIVAIAIGVAMMIFGEGWVRGYYNTIYTGVRNFETGDVQVLNPGYLAEQRRLPLDLNVPGYAALAQKIAADPGVAAVAPRVEFSATIGTAKGSVRVFGRGIEPSTEAKVTVLRDFIRQGTYLQDGGSGLLIGAPLAQKLGIHVGDSVSLSATDRYSAENFQRVVVAGIFEFGYPAVDDNEVFVTVATAQALLGLQNEVTKLVIKLGRGVHEASGVAAVTRDVVGTDVTVYSWRTFAQTIIVATSADIGGFRITIVIMYLLIVIGILNSMSMAIQERVREIGTLRAIGIRRSGLVRLFLSEGTCLAIIASAVGCLVGGAVAYYIATVGFDFSEFERLGLPIPFGSRFHGDYRAADFVIAIAVAIVTTIAGSYFPTRRASRLGVADALTSRVE